MIVDPDFPDHWKTRMLVGLLDGDEVAPVYVIRLWAHCQNRRQWTFTNVSAEALKALCRFPGHANKLESSLAASGFIRREADTLIVCGWDDYNASLVASWSNGRKGGRPPKPRGLDNQKNNKPMGSREEKRREDNTPKPPKGGDCVDLGFEEFWALYPLKKHYRPDAERVWRSLDLRPETVPIVLAALEAELESPAWQRGRITTPQKWLRGRPWEQTPKSRLSERDALILKYTAKEQGK